MPSFLKPHLRVQSVLELTPQRLQALGIDSLLLDVDCTLKRYRSEEIGPEVAAWLEEIREAGIGMCLVSNGRGGRIRRLAEKLGLPFVAKALKPFPFGCRRAVRRMGFDRRRTAMVGDQLFADVMAGRLAGMQSILVRPIHPEEEPWFTRLKRPLERLFLRPLRGTVEGMHPLVRPPEKTDASSPGPDRSGAASGGESAAATPRGGRDLLAAVGPYVAIARPDHWFKNVFMLLGVVLAYFYQLNHPGVDFRYGLLQIAWGVIAVCLVASSNYVINEILDARTDRNHPVKRLRPIPAGRVNLKLAYLEWLLLAAVGLGMAAVLPWPFFLSALALWGMGLVYNVPPLRTKEVPYLDVLSESVNNPLRLMLGWFTVTAVQIPPVSLTISYWMIGAFFMATKRFAEYRSLAEPETAGAYRNSFRHYDEGRLIQSMFFYATAAALFLGVFIIRYHLELILSIPLVAGFFGYYMRVALKPDSPAQSPERLYRERGLMAYLVVCVAVFLLLMFVRIDLLYDLFNVPSPEVPPLWRL